MRQVPCPIVIENLQDRPFTRAGVRYAGRIDHAHHAEVLPGKSIRLYGFDAHHREGPKAYDRTFRVGDVAEYDAYNLHYLGRIVAIGPKTVTIAEDEGRTHRLTFYDFSRRHWNFDLGRIAANNRKVFEEC